MKKYRHVDFIRFLCIISVVIGHSIILYSKDWAIYDSNYEVPLFDWLKYFINIFSMPLFFSVSGYLYENKKAISLNVLISKKIKRLIVPYTVIYSIWLVPIRLLIKYENYKNFSLMLFLKNIIFGIDIGHLWFLPTLFLCFIFHYIGELFFKAKLNRVIFIISTMYCLIPISIMPIEYCNSFLQYYCYFYIGKLIRNKESEVKNASIMIIFILVAMSLILSIVTRNAFFVLNNLVKYVCAILCIIYIYKISYKVKIDSKIVNNICTNSFGIYLFHSPLTYITYYKYNNINPILVVIINLVIWGGVAYCMSEFIRRTKLKVLLGE